nr:hypothetical protein [Tanacetum cinerariifolium]
MGLHSLPPAPLPGGDGGEVSGALFCGTWTQKRRVGWRFMVGGGDGGDDGDRMKEFTKPLDEDDDVVVLENNETKEEDVKEDDSDQNKERYTFEDDDDDEKFDDLD